ncbi:ArsR/SmtB family transcription factor [Halosimplex halobium]|uniref:ArsR/SmtB family transcription factor n=1 Tax=Halosimplex halobium TaxID=3396618 RepID=UPI003F57C6C9
MSQSDSVRAAAGPNVERTADPLANDEPPVDVPKALSLLSDEYARELLGVLSEESLSARELVDRLDMSRATVYRRLDRLESAGVLESSMRIDPDGHHRKCFHVIVERMQLAFDSEGLTLEVGE